MYVCVYVYVYMCMYMYVCTYVCICMFAHMFVYYILMYAFDALVVRLLFCSFVPEVCAYCLATRGCRRPIFGVCDLTKRCFSTACSMLGAREMRGGNGSSALTVSP